MSRTYQEQVVELASQLLRSAIADYVQAGVEKDRVRQADAERWLFGDGIGIISFARACEWAGVHPETVRKRARRLRKQPAQIRVLAKSNH